jgi:CheY-like chemotaxis protein
VEIAAAGFDQILLNLVTNARDAIGATGRIEIVVRRVARDLPATLAPGEYVAIDVIDDGPGIPTEVRPRVSEPFFTTKSHGTGLGLAIVAGIVRQAGGALDVAPGPEGGTRASVFLPLSALPLVVVGTLPAPVAMGHGERVLVVDDDPSVRTTVALLVRRGGYIVSEAQSAWDALEILRGGEVRLVLTDVRMPVMSGTELLHAVRALHPNIPVVLMSGYARGELDESIQSADGFLLKPFEHRDLLRMLGDVLRPSAGDLRSAG